MIKQSIIIASMHPNLFLYLHNMKSGYDDVTGLCFGKYSDRDFFREILCYWTENKNCVRNQEAVNTFYNNIMVQRV